MKLRWQIMLVLALGTLLPLFTAGFFFYKLSATRLNERADFAILTLARRVANDIDAFSYRATESARTDGLLAPLVDFLNATPGARTAQTAAISELLRTAAVHDPVNIASCALFDRQGNKIVDTSPQSPSRPESAKNWVRSPLNTGLTVVVPALDDENYRGLWVGAPVRDTSGRIVGVLRLRYEIAVLQQLVAQITESTDGAAFAEIISPGSVILAHGNAADRIGTGTNQLLPLMAPAGSRSQTGLFPSVQWEPASPAAAALGQRDRIATIRLQQTPWILRLHVTAAFYHQAVYDLRRVILALGALMIALAGVSALIVSARISRPITQLARAVARMHQGDAVVEVDIPTSGPGEVGLLARAFNTLSRQLRTTLTALGQRVADLHRSEQQQRQLIDAMPMAIALFGPDRKIHYLNHRFVAWSGYSNTDLPTLDDWWARAVPAATALAEVRARADLVRAEILSPRGQSEPRECTITCHDGTTRLVECRSTRIGDETLVVLTDLSERQRTEATLRESEERFRLLVENSNELVVQVSLGGTILYASPNHTAITGRTPDELLGTSVLANIHPDDLPQIAGKFRSRSASGLFRFRFKDDSWHWFESSGRTFRLSSGEEQGVIVSRDVTARIHAEETGKHLEEQLRQAQKLEAIGTLAGGIAHDFNNILTGIMGNTQLAAMSLPPDHETQPMLDEALKASLRARDLVAQILTFSRRRELQLSPTNLGPVVQEAVKLLRASLPASVSITQELTDDLPLVLCDPTQIHQIVMNLGTNAAHALRPHGGTLAISLSSVQLTPEELRQHPQLRATHNVRLTVRDTGAGMDATTLSRLFEPFFTTKPVGEGTGLGLAVVHGIVQSLAGAITVASTPGVGTTLRVYLAGLQTARPVHPVHPAPLSRGRGELIALVDDEPAVSRFAERALVALGYTCTAFANPAVALATIGADPPPTPPSSAISPCPR